MYYIFINKLDDAEITTFNKIYIVVIHTFSILQIIAFSFIWSQLTIKLENFK